MAVSAVSIDREPLLTWEPTAPKSHPINYFVPNFGPDYDVLATEKHISDTEEKMGHKWIPKKNPDSHDKDYFVPNFGLDSDIVAATDSIKSVETGLGHEWKPVQDDDGAWIVPEAANNASYSYK